jgi:MFS family permease
VLFRDRPFLRLTLANVVFALCSLMFTVGLPIYAMITLRTRAWLLGLLFALNTALLAVSQTIVVRLLEPYRRTRALLLASGLWCVWCGCMALAVQLPAVLLVPYLITVTVVYTLAELTHAPTSNALAAAVVPPGLRGRYMAAFQLSWSFASMLAPGLFALLFTIWPALPWLIFAGLALLGGAIVIGLEAILPAHAVRIRHE